MTSPLQASVEGYNRLVFDNGFSNIDLANTQAPGFSWYMANWGGFPPSNPNNVSVSNGVLTLGNGTDLARMVSAFSDQQGGYIGTVFGGGGYFEIEFYFNVADSVRAVKYPAFFLEPIEHIKGIHYEQWPGQVAGYGHFVEIDIVQINHKPFEDRTGRNDILLATVDWSGVYDAAHNTFGYPYQIQNVSNRVFTPSTVPVDWGKSHKFAVSWVTQKGSTPGYIAYYVDDKPGPIQYYLGPVTSPPLPGQAAPNIVGNWPATTYATAAQTYAVADSAHFAMRVETDPAWPITIYGVKVWQN